MSNKLKQAKRKRGPAVRCNRLLAGPATLTKVRCGSELPKQLEIRNGRIVMKDGRVPIFDFLDGTEITVMPRSDAVRNLDEAMLLRNWAS